VFRCKENSIQYFNFVFPLAFSNLKCLLQGNYTGSIHRKTLSSLWTQFGALASALTYLHETVHTAHGDIRSSNNLIFEGAKDQLALKITDFGHSVDLKNIIAWEQGGVTAQPAWLYDSSELRSALTYNSSQVSNHINILTTEELLSKDVWKIGCIFIEMTTVLVKGGSKGVSHFRQFISTTEDNVISDSFHDTSLEDGLKVKPQVLEWVAGLGVECRKAALLLPLLQRTVSNPSERPTARETCACLIEV
jgi:serine/threonine protein kinase